MQPSPQEMSDYELWSFFKQLFPQGFTGEDVRREIAPEGWCAAPLLLCFHPTPATVLAERLRVHENLRSLLRSDEKERPEPTLESVLLEWEDPPVNEEEEVADLVGRCVWDIFSDNHDVVASDGRIVDIGSFRGAGGFIDDFLSYPEGIEAWGNGDYLRFYMGSVWIRSRADLGPVYRMIFRRIRSLGADWRYASPGIYAVQTTKDSGAAELNQLTASLESANQATREEMQKRQPPGTVLAYEAIYGRLPQGWG